MLDASPTPQPPAGAPLSAINDAFRVRGGMHTTLPGTLVFTAGVSARGDPFVMAALKAVMTFAAFTEDNDPYGEHDFGAVAVAVAVEDERVFWKLDYFADSACDAGAEDPAAGCFRVLTIMMADEY